MAAFVFVTCRPPHFTLLQMNHLFTIIIVSNTCPPYGHVSVPVLLSVLTMSLSRRAKAAAAAETILSLAISSARLPVGLNHGSHRGAPHFHQTTSLKCHAGARRRCCDAFSLSGKHIKPRGLGAGRGSCCSSGPI